MKITLTRQQLLKALGADIIEYGTFYGLGDPATIKPFPEFIEIEVSQFATAIHGAALDTPPAPKPTITADSDAGMTGGYPPPKPPKTMTEAVMEMQESERLGELRHLARRLNDIINPPDSPRHGY
jgi:hypothetical protein